MFFAENKFYGTKKNFFDQIYLHTTFANTATTTATNYL